MPATTYLSLPLADVRNVITERQDVAEGGYERHDGNVCDSVEWRDIFIRIV
jgi:hypothetical protein